jgi:hypothetical protein
MEPVGTIQGIFKWEAQEYVTLEEIKKSIFDRARRIFFAVNFAPGFKTIESGQDVVDNVIIDIVVDEGMKSKTLITDPQKKDNGVILPMVTDYPGEVVWLGYFTVPGYSKYTTPGKHTVTVKVAPRKFMQKIRTRDFSPEAGGVSQMFEYTIVDDHLGGD